MCLPSTTRGLQCETDLESDSGAGSFNLKGITDTIPNDRVNLLVQTGGTRQWDPGDDLGFEIANDKLQRWYYGEDGFVLADETEAAPH